MSGVDRPPWLVRAADIAEHEGRYPPPWRERMPPGHRTAFTHAHLVEEEHEPRAS
jgi:hypothetical protein